MSDTTHRPVEISIVLQGGGALGAYECGGVAALLELMDEAEAGGQQVALRAVTGVSIGAINAACVVGAKDRADARRRLDALWDDLILEAPDFWPRQAQRDLSLFGLPGFYLPRFDILGFPTWTSYYDTRPLLATLKRHVDFATLNTSATAFVVTAVDVESGELKRFSNQALGDDPPTRIAPEHVMASGSLPPQFPWTEIKGRLYWDGGLVDNAPLGDACEAFSGGKDVDRVLVVLNLYPLCAPKPRKLADVEDRLHELSFGNQMRQDRRTAQRINDLVGTIDELATLVPYGSFTPDLQARVDRARQFKQIKVVDIDVQDAAVPGEASAQDTADDQYGLRDFSRATVRSRRERGHRIARARLTPVFANLGLVPSEQARPAVVPASN